MNFQFVSARLNKILSTRPQPASGAALRDGENADARARAPRGDDAERKLDLDRLEALAREFFDAQSIKDLEQLVGAAMGAPMRHLSMNFIEPPRRALRAYVNERRTHSRHKFAVGGQVAPEWRHAVKNGSVKVFVKTGGLADVAPIEHALTTMRPRFFRAPRVLGAYRGRRDAATVWEFVKGGRRSFANIGFAAQIQLVHAIAEINATPYARLGLSEAAPPPPASWFAERLRARPPDQQSDWARELETLYALDRALPLERRVREHPERFVSHNDLNANNVLVGDDLIIIDWEGARLSPAGADLGFLYALEREDVLFDVYVGAMAGFGHRLDKADVWRNAGVARVLRLLYGGWARRNLEQVRLGIAILERLERGL